MDKDSKFYLIITFKNGDIERYDGQAGMNVLDAVTYALANDMSLTKPIELKTGNYRMFSLDDFRAISFGDNF